MSKFIKSFGFAFNGWAMAFKEQANFRFHFWTFAIVLILGGLCTLSLCEWLAVLIVAAGVFVAELFNSSLEKLTDLVSPDFHPLAKQTKDLAAGAVLVAAVTSAIVGLLVFGKHFLQFLSDYL